MHMCACTYITFESGRFHYTINVLFPFLVEIATYSYFEARPEFDIYVFVFPWISCFTESKGSTWVAARFRYGNQVLISRPWIDCSGRFRRDSDGT